MSRIALSTNFFLDEMTRSRLATAHGIDNTPPPECVTNLKRLATTILQPARDHLDCPLQTDSGYRCETVNRLAGGADNSAHLDGRAGDEIPLGVNIRVAFDDLRHSDIPFDQLILEANEWLHMAVAREGVPPRREFLIATRVNGKWKYTPV